MAKTERVELSLFKQKIREQAKTVTFEWHGSVYNISEEDLEKLVGKQAILDIGHKACDRKSPNFESYPKMKVNLISIDVVERGFDGAVAELRQKLQGLHSEIEDELKRICDEIDRQCFTNPEDILFEVKTTIDKLFEELLRELEQK